MRHERDQNNSRAERNAAPQRGLNSVSVAQASSLDQRPEARDLDALQASIQGSPRVAQLRELVTHVNGGARVRNPAIAFSDERPAAQELSVFRAAIHDSPRLTQLREMSSSVNSNANVQATALPESGGAATKLPMTLQSGIESLSGLAMDDVGVYRGSSRPAQLKAHAFAQGNSIYLGPGREKHLAHEAWHVVQQKRGQVPVTAQLRSGIPINDSPALEREADEMGASAERAGSASQVSGVLAPAPRRVLSANVNPPVQGFWDLNGLEQEELEQISGLAKHGEKYILAAFKHFAKTDAHLAAHVDALTDKLLSRPRLNEAGKALLFNSYSDANRNTAGELMQRVQDIVNAPIPPVAIDETLGARMESWYRRLGARESKSSTAETKRQKRLDITGTASMLMLTHTAPPEETTENSHHQGKDVQPGKGEFNYFRTGDNRQSHFLKDNRKHFVFLKEQYDFYRELDSGAEFEGQRDLNDSVMHARFGSGRYLHSGYGAEVNSYAKEKYLRGGGLDFQGDRLVRGNRAAKRYVDTRDQSLLTEHIDALTEPGAPIKESHNSAVLRHCREIVNVLAGLQWQNFRVVNADEVSGFLTYPCPIIEPINKKLMASDTKKHMEVIVTAFNNGSKIKMYPRNSFGFLYPTIADLERSIRLWPGQVDPNYYLTRIIETLKYYDYWLGGGREKAPEQKHAEPATGSHHAAVYTTLSRTMAYIRGIFQKGGFRGGDELDFIQQRVFVNLMKTRALQKMREDNNFGSLDVEDVFLEITQVIENLNEAGLQLLELQRWKPSAEEIRALIEVSYGAAARNGGYKVCGAALTHSGMQAGMIAMNLRKKLVFELGPAYFEFPNNKALNENLRGIKTTGAGRTLHNDPAYNFTSHEDVLHHMQLPAVNSEQNCVVLDITNVRPAEIAGILGRHRDHTPSAFLYASLSKHFQFGMDRFTLGVVLELSKNVSAPSQLGTYGMPVELMRYFIVTQQANNIGLEEEFAAQFLGEPNSISSSGDAATSLGDEMH